MMESIQMAANTLLQVHAESARACAVFQWGGTISALILLILNCARRRSETITSLLVLYLMISFPTVFFNILRGQLGRWISFFTVSANLFFPETFSVSRIILFVITPTRLADYLRYSTAGGVLCLVIGALLIVLEVRGIGELGTWGCNLLCFCYSLGVALLIFFTTYSLVGSF